MNWRKILLLVSILLLVASFVAYGLRAAQMTVLARDWPSYSDALKRQAIALFDLDRPLAVQYWAFLLLFLPGVLLGIAYGLYGLPPGPVQHSPMTKILLILALVTNVITVLSNLLLAPSPVLEDRMPWWFLASMAVFGLTGCVFSLAIWNGRKWGLYGLALSMGLAAIFNLLGGMPWLNALFGFSLVIILWYFLRPVWWQME